MKKLITLNETVEVLERLVSRKQISRTKAFNMLLEHKRFLDQPLTKEMFVGDKAIFVGFEAIENPNTISEIEYFSNKCVVKFLRSYVLNGEKINKVLHDLAELTKSNQLELK